MLAPNMWQFDFHFIHEHVMKKSLDVQYVNYENQIVDFFLDYNMYDIENYN